jgi:hypothetical protein
LGDLLVVLVLDEEIHTLVGTRPDPDEAGIADHLLDREDIRIADAADDLHGEIANVTGRIRGELLGLTDEPPHGQ